MKKDKLNAEQKTDSIELNTTPIDQELDIELLQKAQAEQQEEPESDHVPFKFDTRRDERQVALYLIYALDRAEYTIDLDDVIKVFENGFEIKIPKKSFAVQLVKGAVEDREKLDRTLEPFLKNWRLERLGCCTRLILYLALWEMQQPDTVKSIVINEAIELAKAFAEKDAYRFVNGILDEIAKSFAEQEKETEQEKGQEEK